jgi:gliding motility-associated-like protein
MKRRLLPFWIFSALIITSFSSFQAAVVASFSSSATTGCSPLTVSFKDLSSGNPTSWKWNFGNGNTSTLQNPGTTYTTAGTFTVTLNASDGTTSSQSTAVITVYGKPIAGFTPAPAVSCVGTVVTFTDNSTPGSGPIMTWSWDYGDGHALNTSAGSTSHTYTAPGSYPSSLIITDSHGCSGNIVVPVTVNAVPSASFTATPTSSCTAPLLVTFTNTTAVSGTVVYSWDFGDGSSSAAASPSHNYTATGLYSVKLVVTENGCKDSALKNNLIVIRKIAADFSADTTKVCAGQTVKFTDKSVPLATSQSWTFGDGGTSLLSNPSHLYTIPGTYTVSMQATDASGCTDAKVKNALITVYPNPLPGFTSTSTNGCSLPFSVTFTDTTSGAVSWSWTFGDGGTSTLQKPVHNYTVAGSYNVTLTVKNANGCSATVLKNNLVVISLPVVKFGGTPLKGCAPYTVTFTDSSVSSNPIVSWVWDFGNGQKTTTAIGTAMSTYTLPGQYTVKLKIITANGCVDSLIKVNYVKAGVKPISNFTYNPDTICFGMGITFTNASVNANGWKWIFGDGANDTVPNPMHVYGDTGTFTVSLIALNNGCPDTMTKLKIITVNPPIPSFTSTLSCINYYKVLFKSTSIGADSVTWDFGDGTFDNSNNLSPTHTYATRGSKTVILTAYNYKSKCSSASTSAITIAVPIASFTTSPAPPYGCVPLTIAFVNTSQDANTNAWDLGTGPPSIALSPSEVYTNIGVYTVKLTVTDVNGCKNTVSDSNLVHALGVRFAGFSASPLTGCTPLLTTFRDSSQDDSVIVRRTWAWGDLTSNTIVNGVVATHNYTARGIYTITLTVQDTNGCTATVSKPAYVNPTKPYPAMLVDTFSCKGNVLSFNASATTAVGGTPLTYSWTFGDGGTAVSASPITTHAYASDNTYTVTLTVSDANGCDSTIKEKILILQPVAAFKDSTVSYGCGTKQVQFIDQSTGYVNNWHWDFGNGATSTLPNPLYTYTSPGIYKVKLIVMNKGGCIDTVIKDSLVVVPGPIGSFTFNPNRGCVPLTVNFNCTSTNTTTFTWDFGDGTVLPQTTFSNVTHTYIRNLNVTPILLLGDTLPNGVSCQLPATNLTGNVITTQVLNVSVIPSGVVTIYEDTYVPLATSVSGGSGNFSYSWSPSLGLSCDSCANPVVAPTGQSTEYYVTIRDNAPGGCTNIDSVQVIFMPCDLNTTVPNVFTPNDDGTNDVLYVSGLCIRTQYLFTVYDRWGVIMFQTAKRHSGWDGRTISGQPAPDGVYYYIINVDSKAFKGFVQLIR